MTLLRRLVALLVLTVSACEPPPRHIGEGSLRTGWATDTTASDAGAGSSTGGGALRWYTTCGDPACNGYTKPYGVPLCNAGQQPDTSCDVEGATCDPVSYCNTLLVCATKDPKQGPSGCPVSRARFKKDIRYVEPDERERYAADLYSLRLATFRYREVSASTPPRLGIILDDDEQGIWVDARNDRVDLYGYASLAVAALQVQKRQLTELQAEVERLSARLDRTNTCEP
jgi:hypothetical protein